MNADKIKRIRDHYLASPVDNKGAPLLRSLMIIRGCGPEYDLYNTLTVVQGCDLLLAESEIQYAVGDTSFKVSVEKTHSLHVYGLIEPMVQTGYQVYDVDRKKLFEMIRRALSYIRD